MNRRTFLATITAAIGALFGVRPKAVSPAPNPALVVRDVLAMQGAAVDAESFDRAAQQWTMSFGKADLGYFYANAEILHGDSKPLDNP